MAGELRYIIFDTDMGCVGVLASAKGLLCTTLPQHSVQEVRRLLGDSVNCADWSPHPLNDLVGRLRIYFSGYMSTFPDELDLSGATAFQRKVWEMTRLIPYGETRSYSWLAEQVKRPKAVRAVGQALGKNPLPIVVPCHRVTASDGGLGGYGGGIEVKKYLLWLEASAAIGKKLA